MRSLILVVGTIFLLSLGFLAYWWGQKPVARSAGADHHYSAEKPETLDPAHDSGIGVSESPFLQQFDPKTGQLASQFRADRCIPQRDGRYKVTNTDAQFFLKDQKVLRIQGHTGTVTMGHLPAGGNAFAEKQAQQPPSRGELHGVVVTLFHDGAPDAPILTIEMDNASFDNESFKIYTETYTTHSGHVIPADQVPVKMTGEDYDFQGRGLTIRWNEREHRLELLEIAHGEMLTVKHPGKLSASRSPAQSGPVGSIPATPRLGNIMPRPRLLEGAPVRLLDLTDSAPVTFASDRIRVEETPPSSPGLAGAPATRASDARGNTGPADAPIYRATFLDDVKITQNGATLITAESMLVDFPMDNAKDSTTQPATQRTFDGSASRPGATGHDAAPGARIPAAPSRGAAPMSGHVPATNEIAPRGRVGRERRGESEAGDGAAGASAAGMEGATRPAPAIGLASTSRTGATAPSIAGAQGAGNAHPIATTRPDEMPLHIYWTGMLRVEPFPTAQAIAPGESIVTFKGKHTPVIAHQQGAEIRCAVLKYQSEDKSVDARSGAEPVIMTTTDARGATVIHTSALMFSQGRDGQQKVQLIGRSSAVMPSQPGAAPITVQWTHTGMFYFAPAGIDGKSQIDHADLTGDVKVDHPQLKLQSDELSLDFDPQEASATARLAIRPAGAVSEGGAAVKADDHDRAAAPTSVAARSAGTMPASNPSSSMAQANLKQIEADGNVHCQIIDTNKKNENIDCDRLNVVTSSTPDGHFVPRTINADGHVHAVNPDEDLTAGHLAVTLTTRPVVAKAAAPVAAGSVAIAPPGIGPDSANHRAGVSGGPVTLPTAATHPVSSDSDLVVQSLIAHQDVKVITLKDNTRAKADQLLVDIKNGKTSLKLLGQPAEIIDKQTTLRCPVIEIFPDDQQMSADGAGEIHSVQQDTPTSPARPLDIVWTRSLRIDGRANTVDALGQVSSTMVESDGTVDIAQGDRCKMLLADDNLPTTRASTRLAATGATAATVPATRSAALASGGREMSPTTMSAATMSATTHAADLGALSDSSSGMGHKIVHQVIFQDNAEVHSTLLGADGRLMRRITLLAPTIQYDITPANSAAPATTQSATSPSTPPRLTQWATTLPAEPGDAKAGMFRKLTVPCAGRLGVEDYRPASTQATTNPANNDAAGAASARGATAFQWSKSMVYDEATHQMVMTGDVLIVHKDAGGKSDDNLTMNADVVWADIAVTAPATQPARTVGVSGPASRMASSAPTTERAAPAEESRMQVRKLTAQGHLHLVARSVDVTADWMEYDPTTHVMTARGTDRVPAVFSRSVAGEHGYQPISADELQWNTETDLPRVVRPMGQLGK